MVRFLKLSILTITGGCGTGTGAEEEGSFSSSFKSSISLFDFFNCWFVLELVRGMIDEVGIGVIVVVVVVVVDVCGAGVVGFEEETDEITGNGVIRTGWDIFDNFFWK